MKSVIFKNKNKLVSLALKSVRWQLNNVLKHTPMPLACGLYLTNKCNLKCTFCNIWRKKEMTVLPFEKAKKLVDDLSDIGCFYFSVTGGEPLLVSHLFDLLAYARKSSIRHLHMVTNGFVLDRKKAQQLGDTGIDEISISIDGPEKIHDANRGVSGAYRRAVQAIEHMKACAPHVHIVLNAIFSPNSPSECLHVVELARRYDILMKVQPLNQHPLFNKDNAVTIASRGRLESKRQGIREVIAQLLQDDRVANSPVFLKNIYNFYFAKDKLVCAREKCLFGYHHLEVLENGRVFPCLEGLDWENGFAYDRDLSTILRSTAYRGTLEKLQTCNRCRENYYICYYEPRIAFPFSHFIKNHVFNTSLPW